MKILALILILAALAGCITRGPKNPAVTTAEALNGENYSSFSQVGPVYLLERKTIPMKITGRVFCGEGLTAAGANRADVKIQKDSKVLNSSMAAFDGSYLLEVPYDGSAEYTISALAKCGRATVSLPGALTKTTTSLDIHLN